MLNTSELGPISASFTDRLRCEGHHLSFLQGAHNSRKLGAFKIYLGEMMLSQMVTVLQYVLFVNIFEGSLDDSRLGHQIDIITVSNSCVIRLSGIATGMDGAIHHAP